MTDSALTILGITGPIACGKSTVARMAVEHGAIDYIDADRVTHELMARDTALTRAIAAEFGPSLLTREGAVDRPALAAIVFADPVRLSQLELLVHPEVQDRVASRIAWLRGNSRTGVVVLEAIKLLQSPLLSVVNTVWLVTCSEVLQRDRLRAERGMSDAEAGDRMASQPAFDATAVDVTIVNDGNLEDLRRKVTAEWRGLALAH